ncbi:hypothetical protein CEXT_691251, partial [Caerostris extrusa]
MVCVVLCGFIICWSPMQVTVLYAEFWHSASQFGEVGWTCWLEVKFAAADWLKWGNRLRASVSGHEED